MACGAIGLVGCDYDKLDDIDVSEVQGRWVVPAVYDALTVGDLVQRDGDGGSKVAYYGPDSVAYVEYTQSRWANQVGCNDTAFSTAKSVPFAKELEADVQSHFYVWKDKVAIAGLPGKTDHVYIPTSVKVKRILPYACIAFDPDPNERLEPGSTEGPAQWKRNTRLTGEASVNGGPWAPFDAPFHENNLGGTTIDSLSAIQCASSSFDEKQTLEGEGIPIKIRFRNLALQGADGHDVSRMVIIPGFSFSNLLLSEAKGRALVSNPGATYGKSFQPLKLGVYRDEHGKLKQNGRLRIPVELFRNMTHVEGSFPMAHVFLRMQMTPGVKMTVKDMALSANYVVQPDPTLLEVLRYSKATDGNGQPYMAPVNAKGELLTTSTSPLRIESKNVEPTTVPSINFNGENYVTLPKTEYTHLSSDGKDFLLGLFAGNSDIAQVTGRGPYEFLVDEKATLQFEVSNNPPDGSLPTNVGVEFGIRVPFDATVKRMSIGSPIELSEDTFPVDALDYLAGKKETGAAGSVKIKPVTLHFRFINGMPFSFYTKLKFVDENHDPIMVNGQELVLNMEEVTTTSAEDKADGQWPAGSGKRLLVSSATLKAGADNGSVGLVADQPATTEAEASLTYEEYKALTSKGPNGGAKYMHLFADVHTPEGGAKQVKICKDNKLNVAIGLKVQTSYSKNDEK